MKDFWIAVVCMAIALLLIILSIICNGCVTVNKELNIFVVEPVVVLEIEITPLISKQE